MRCSVVICCTLFSREHSFICKLYNSFETPSSLESSKIVSLGEKCFSDVMEKTSESALLLVLGENYYKGLAELWRFDLGMRVRGWIILIILI
jgi:hypothetical protein